MNLLWLKMLNHNGYCKPVSHSKSEIYWEIGPSNSVDQNHTHVFEQCPPYDYFEKNNSHKIHISAVTIEFTAALHLNVECIYSIESRDVTWTQPVDGNSELMAFFHLTQVSWVPCCSFPRGLNRGLCVSMDPVTAEVRPKLRQRNQSHNK